MLKLGKNINIFNVFPAGISWFCAFLIGDYLSRFFHEGSIFPHRTDQKNKFRRLILAALIMNLFSDLTGSWFMRLWYYPNINLFLYFILAPLGYILFGLALYVFYRFFKRNNDHDVKPGRMNNFQNISYKLIINGGFVLSIIGFVISLSNYQKFYQQINLKWFQVYLDSKIVVDLSYFIVLWLSVFFMLEYTCYRLNQETLIRDIIRGNFLPLFSIFVASAACIILVEFFNYPFELWVFSNWPLGSIRFLGIPILAFFLWPMQYLILLPLIRIFDGKNIENVW